MVVFDTFQTRRLHKARLYRTKKKTSGANKVCPLANKNKKIKMKKRKMRRRKKEWREGENEGVREKEEKEEKKHLKGKSQNTVNHNNKL